MEFLETIVLGIIQGLTEFLPVSSSGHLLIAYHIFGWEDKGVEFDIAVHAGSLLSLLWYFKNTWISLPASLISNRKRWLDRKASLSERKIIFVLLVGTLPAALIGVIALPLLDDNLRTPQWTGWAFIGTGILLLSTQLLPRFKHNATDEVSYKQAVVVGLSQAISITPGISRSGITITAGVFSGLSRRHATEFSFMLAMPIIAGSALFTAVGIDSNYKIEDWLTTIIGFFVSFVVSLVTIGLMVRFVQRIGLAPFGIYATLIGILILVFLA